MPKPPAPPPEARLLKLARLRRNSTSITEAAALAGVSVSLWRQVEAGYSTPAAGVRVPKIAPADTLAVMSRPLGIIPAELAKAGREDAAAILAELTQPEPAAPEPPLEPPVLGDDVKPAVVAALYGPAERRIWAHVRSHLADTPAGRALFADANQAAAWPPESADGLSGGAPFGMTGEARSLLDAIPAAALWTDQYEVIIWNLDKLPYRKRVSMIREYREPVREPARPPRLATRAGLGKPGTLSA